MAENKPSYMKVKDLRKLLKKFDDDDTVFLIAYNYDEEGSEAKLKVVGKKTKKVIMHDEASCW